MLQGRCGRDWRRLIFVRFSVFGATGGARASPGPTSGLFSFAGAACFACCAALFVSAFKAFGASCAGSVLRGVTAHASCLFSGA